MKLEKEIRALKNVESYLVSINAVCLAIWLGLLIGMSI